MKSTREIIYFDRLLETAGPEQLAQHQLERLRAMLAPILASNAFYRRKLGAAGLARPEDIRSLDDLRQLPFTTKGELNADQLACPLFGSNLTHPLERYIRFSATSGTTGDSVRWLDTAESWDWMARCWAAVYCAAGVRPGDRVFLAFSFGPFLGFWTAYEGTRHVSALALPGGGQTSLQRLKNIIQGETTVLVSTPTYALHLAELARQTGLDIAGSSIRVTIHAGEPGASIPSTKRRIEEAWGAECFDHSGATEVGPVSYECLVHAGLHVNEGEYIAEVIDTATGQPADEGELVVTNLGRIGSPVIRYRTGDRVKLLREPCACGRTFVRMDGGVIGRLDDMLLVRGINVYPSAIENILRKFEVSEYAVELAREGEMDEIEIKVELDSRDPVATLAGIDSEIRQWLGLRPRLTPMPDGSLPRFEHKARRVFDRRPR